MGGWVQVSLGKKISGKLSQNSPELVRIFWGSIPCVFWLYIIVYTIWKVVRFECSVHVSDGFPKKKFGYGLCGSVVWAPSNSPQLFRNFLNFAKPLCMSLINYTVHNIDHNSCFIGAKGIGEKYVAWELYVRISLAQGDGRWLIHEDIFTPFCCIYYVSNS